MKQFLQFFNLLDKDNNLSITNIAVIVVLTKIAIAPSFTIEEFGVLMLALLNYAHKRFETSRVSKSSSQSAEAIQAQYESQIQAIREELAQVKSSADEANDKASKLSLASGLNKLTFRG